MHDLMSESLPMFARTADLPLSLPSSGWFKNLIIRGLKEPDGSERNQLPISFWFPFRCQRKSSNHQHTAEAFDIGCGRRIFRNSYAEIIEASSSADGSWFYQGILVGLLGAVRRFLLSRLNRLWFPR